jgi:hypothetical protein
VALVRLAAVYRPSDHSSAAAGSLACLPHLPSLCPRRAFVPCLDFASRCVGPDRRRLASAPGQHALRVPAIGAPLGELATVTDGLRSSRAAPVAYDRASGPAEVASLEVCFPVSVCEPRCAGPGLPASGLSRCDVDAFSTSDCTQLRSPAGVRLVLAVFIRAVAPKLPIPGPESAGRNVFGVAPRVIRARFLQD